MNTYLMKKAMIEAAVTRGIKEMEEDPKRSVRRLADLGKQFSKSRFQDMVFSVMQELLDNEDSAYYDMVHNLLRNSDHEALKKFGINFGYMGWTYGADRIRTNEKKENICIPWCIMLRYDLNLSDGLSIDNIRMLIDEGQKLGIFVYFIQEVGAGNDSYALLELLEQYKDCAFIWIKNNGRLTAAQIQMLKMCSNTVVSLPSYNPEAFLTAALLRDQKVLFSFCVSYDDSFCSSDLPVIMESSLSSETSLLFLIAKDDAKWSAAKDAYHSRLEQKEPFVMMDLYGDGISISRITVEHPYLLEIDEKGYVTRPEDKKKISFPFGKPLTEALRDIMPAFDSSKV